ncbi:4Fe-4S dicluster domain-containing protein [Vibrio sp. MEBiC08052]|uniref:4Fe-4S dicluster domain-containing protein n=1 Tax=Vibrio sp. MEBiC08052 TaxID=1761910 RepID=UPI003FCD52F6
MVFDVESRKYVEIDFNKCIGCKMCIVSCALSHKNQIGSIEQNLNSRLFLNFTAEKRSASVCQHCTEPECLSTCLNNAMSIVDGLVTINSDKCTGCGLCVDSCNFNGIHLIKRKKRFDSDSEFVANKCDLCISNKSGLACVNSCVVRAIKIIEVESAVDNNSRQSDVNDEFIDSPFF